MEYFESLSGGSDFQVIETGSSNAMDIKILEIFDIKEKRKWMDFFMKGYNGGKIALNEKMFGVDCRFFVANRNGNSLGFIRITNKTQAYEKYCDQEVWCASDAFVKKAYRSQGVLHELIDYVVKNCKVKVLRIETERLYRCFHYYHSLGFTNLFEVIDSDLSIAVQTDFVEISDKRNADVA